MNRNNKIVAWLLIIQTFLSTATGGNILILKKEKDNTISYSVVTEDKDGNLVIGKISQIVEYGKAGPVIVVPPSPPVVPPVTPPAPPVVVPPITPDPKASLTEVVTKATAAIPNYSLKEGHRRFVAFSLTLMASSSAKAPVGVTRASFEKCVDAVTTPHPDNWKQWKIDVGKKLDSMGLTSETIGPAFVEISQALTADLPASSFGEDYNGLPSYGINPTLIKWLMEMLLPILLEIIKEKIKS